MCGIAGIISKSEENVVPAVRMMLSCMVHRGPDGAGIAADGQVAKSDSFSQLDSAVMKGSSALGHTRLAIVGGTCGAQPFRSCDGRLILEHNGEIYNYKKLRAKLDGRHQFTTETDSEVIVHLLEENLRGISLLRAIRKTVAQLDGVYVLVIKDERTGDIALVRDRIGVRQLYYADTDKFFAFASELKALWRLGISEPTKRVLPCEALIVSSSGRARSFSVMRPVLPIKRTIKTMTGAVNAYRKALLDSMRKRTQDFDRIGIIFSGGIDSVLVAKLAAEMVPEVKCYTCGSAGSTDIAYAKLVADKLGLDLAVAELDEHTVEGLIPQVIEVIEDNNSGQVEVALPVYGAVKLAKQDGIRVMLTGQGADELFGGYSWYARVAEKEGFRKLRRHMFEDLLLLYRETLEREDKITMAHSIELREPFLDQEVIRVAMSCNLRLNFLGENDPYGKRIHRNLAVAMGIPKEIAYRVKEAAQHGSGMHDMIDKVARRNGFDESAITASYAASLSAREKVGSSQRYGYLFADEKIWNVESHVQMYLDEVARKVRPAHRLQVSVRPRSANLAGY